MIDLTGAVVDASDLVWLIDALADARGAGGDLRIVDAGGANARLIARTRLSTVFDVHESVEGAISSVSRRETRASLRSAP